MSDEPTKYHCISCGLPVKIDRQTGDWSHPDTVSKLCYPDNPVAFPDVRRYHKDQRIQRELAAAQERYQASLEAAYAFVDEAIVFEPKKRSLAERFLRWIYNE